MRYKAIISSDWNECLAPCRPFDYISYLSPELEPELNTIFRQCTGNEISLEMRPARIRLIGDSGGDGPHFEWGLRNWGIKG